MDAFFLLLSLYFSSNAIPQVSPRRESDDVVLYDGRDVHASETWQAFWVKLNRRFPADNRPLESGIAHGSGMKPASEECFARTEASSFRLLSVPLFSWHIAPPWEAIREWIPDDDAPELSIKNLSRLPINVAWLSVSRQKCAMVKPPDLRAYLDEWPYDAEDNVRRTCGSDGRAIILVRTPMGLEHCECDGRPDGQRVHGMGSAFDFHHARIAAARLAGRVDACELSAGDCMVLAQEAAAYHHRMLLLFRLRDWARVERDTERALRLIEFIRLHAWQEEDRVQFDPWRPGVTRIHAVARAMFLLENGRHREACEIARSMGIPGAACDGLSRNTHLGEALLAGVRADTSSTPCII